MTALELNETYGSIISPTARVSVPPAWLPAIHVALQSIADLPTEVRAFVIVMGVLNEGAELTFHVAAATPYISDAGMAQLRGIIETAQRAVKGRVH